MGLLVVAVGSREARHLNRPIVIAVALVAPVLPCLVSGKVLHIRLAGASRGAVWVGSGSHGGGRMGVAVCNANVPLDSSLWAGHDVLPAEFAQATDV